MKKTMLRTLATCITFAFLVTATGTVFATTPLVDASNEKTRIQDLMDCGLTQRQAEKLVRVEKISKQLEQNGQTLEMDGDKVVIKDSGKPIIVNITNDDKNFITTEVEKATKRPKISEAQKRADIAAAMEKNPGRKKYRMPYRILCNGVQREGAKLGPALASELFCYVPLHKIWYGVLRGVCF